MSQPMPPGTPQGPWHPRVDLPVEHFCGGTPENPCDCAEQIAEIAKDFRSLLLFSATRDSNTTERTR